MKNTEKTGYVIQIFGFHPAEGKNTCIISYSKEFDSDLDVINHFLGIRKRLLEEGYKFIKLHYKEMSFSDYLDT